MTAFRTPGDAAGSAPAFDPTVAQPARVYDYWLGGKDNFEADRVAGEQAIGAYPAICGSARANRAFLARAVSYLAGQRGIRQYLDLGTGLPSAPNTHEVAQSIAPQARVVYVDNDPMVVSHARALLVGGPQGITEHVEADLRDTGAILARAAAVLDFTEPVAVMLLAVLEYLPRLDEIRQTLGRLVAAIPPGSFLVISHAASDINPARMAEMTRRLNGHLAGASYAARTRDVVTGFFDGLDLVDPGVVQVTQWHPQSQIESARTASQWGGVALKPEDPRRYRDHAAALARTRPGLGQGLVQVVVGSVASGSAGRCCGNAKRLRSSMSPSPRRAEKRAVTDTGPAGTQAPKLDTSVPHSARVWNYWLGGKDNYPADRAMGDEILAMAPDLPRIARLQRAFLASAIQYLAVEAGIRQFLDIGTGLPTAANTHQAAQAIAPQSRIVYVDNDPLVLVHARALLTSSPEGACDYIDADVRDPGKILAQAAKTLDFSQPIAVMLLGILGQIPDSDHPEAIVATLVEAIPPGSYVAISDGVNTSKTFNEAAAHSGWYHVRSPAQIADFFAGLELVEPGLVSLGRWRSSATLFPEQDNVPGMCGIGRKL